MKGSCVDSDLIFVADVHGEWLELYERVPPNAVIFVCGDAEPIRNEADVELVPAPGKHLKLGSFFLFWEEGKVPAPTYVMLGNHEPFFWLHEYEANGPSKLMENFWILSRSGLIELCGFRIAYLSRVFSSRSYEAEPWTPSQLCRKSKMAGRFSKADVENLLNEVARADGKVDILALHENPLFCSDEEGRKVYQTIVELVEPSVVVCGHMHEPIRGEFHGVPVVGLGRNEPVRANELLSDTKRLKKNKRWCF